MKVAQETVDSHCYIAKLRVSKPYCNWFDSPIIYCITLCRPLLFFPLIEALGG